MIANKYLVSIGIAIILLSLLCIPLLIYFAPSYFEHLVGFIKILFISGILITFSPIIISKFNQLKRIKYGDTQADFENAVQRLIDKNLKSINEEGTSFVNHDDAFNDAADQVKKILEEEPKADIEFKLIAISMRYSADFIKNHMIQLAKEYPYAKLSWRICLVDPKYIESLNINNDDYNWVNQSNAVVEYLKHIKERIDSKELSSLNLDFCFYKTIPQWHGLFIKAESISRYHLYFGRTDWKIRRNKKPIMRVGGIEYRYFDYSTKAGIRKIKLFSNWFNIYENWDEFINN